MQIIEFNGLPGTGKTTIAEALMDQMQEKGKRCIKTLPDKGLIKSILYSLLHPSCLILIYLLNRLQKQNQSFSQKFSSAYLVLHYYQMYMKCERSNSADYLIIDQGIIQALISMAHLAEMHASATMGKIARTILSNVSFLEVDCMINKDIAFERIRNRKSAGSRLESLDDVSLKSAYRVQAGNFRVVRSLFGECSSHNVISLDTSDNISDNVSIILNRLRA